MSRRLGVQVQASKPVVMVNSCTGKMGRAVADAAVRAGLTLAPYTLCSDSEAADKKTVEVAGQQLQLIGPSTRDEVIQQVGERRTGERSNTVIAWYSRNWLHYGHVYSMAIALPCLSALCLIWPSCFAGPAAAPQSDHG